MRIAVIGAGAVGCFYGAMLLRAGHDVTLIGRQTHVDAINAQGLYFESPIFTGFIPAKAATDIADLTPPDLVLFAVKSGDTDDTAAALRPILKPDTIVLSLQNGVDNPQRLRAIVSQPVIAAAVYVAAEMPAAGHIKHNGRGELVIGASPQSEALAKLLSDASVPTTIADDIDAVQWSKLINNCAYNALSAVAGIAYGEMFKVDGVPDIVTNAVVECLEVARACGISLPADLLDKTLALAASMPLQQSSTSQDLARGKPSEIDFLNGFIVRKGAEHGIPTPTNHALQVMVKLVERSGSRRA
ncbi:ketopantoate reductase family protein [Tardiphaga sp. P9-11]|uniref:ketopantoate reductase family protein n=1 Tax=Tardiphaga sp. P9-11 TaxID=2024614 RepID=UPI0011F2D39A|nr:ketopantoate reductase family protein [Tardiphaga sp. P9-11]KAA0075260.1 ketopantoate reductase family protein [Tardiphaga sp. P9-11]